MKESNKQNCPTAAVFTYRRFADRPALAALVAEMAAAHKRRKRKTPWITDTVRAEMLRRYGDVLDSPDELDGFLRWVVEDARYLAAEGNFQLFCHIYLKAKMDERDGLWVLACGGKE